MPTEREAEIMAEPIDTKAEAILEVPEVPEVAQEPTCFWKRIRNNPLSTSGMDMRKNENLPCNSCDGCGCGGQCKLFLNVNNMKKAKEAILLFFAVGKMFEYMYL